MDATCAADGACRPLLLLAALSADDEAAPPASGKPTTAVLAAGAAASAPVREARRLPLPSAALPGTGTALPVRRALDRADTLPELLLLDRLARFSPPFWPLALAEAGAAALLLLLVLAALVVHSATLASPLPPPHHCCSHTCGKATPVPGLSLLVAGSVPLGAASAVACAAFACQPCCLPPAGGAAPAVWLPAAEPFLPAPGWPPAEPPFAPGREPALAGGRYTGAVSG